MVKDYQRLLASNPARRLNPAKILETNEYFQNKMVDTITFLENLAAKDSTDKDTFFRKLTPELARMCKAIAVHKVLPMVSQALELGTVSAVAMQPWLQIAKTLPPDQFSSKVIPTVIKLFASADRAVRVTLLNHMELFIEQLTPTQMDEQVPSCAQPPSLAQQLVLSTGFPARRRSADVSGRVKQSASFINPSRSRRRWMVRAGPRFCFFAVRRFRPSRFVRKQMCVGQGFECIYRSDSS